MITFEYEIKDELGIHARPAGLIVKATGGYNCNIQIKKGEKSADAKKLFALMSLSVKCKDTITVEADGDKEEEALAAIKKVLEEYL